MRFHQPLIPVRWFAAAGAVLLMHASAPLAAEPPKPGAVTVLDEACVERRMEMCLRLADGRDTVVLESSLEKDCSSLTCGRGWHKKDLGRYGQLGPICECQRRGVLVTPGRPCADGFMESAAAGPGGAGQALCELPELKMEQYRGFEGYEAGWYWPATPWDLMTCLQFSRFGPGSGACRKSVPEK
ncbi:MAG TPA: hypothetical protein VLC55_11430 [Burkholderiales bacterium]|nr:hypothetical protein [Burkholderiales bacterium]